MSATPVYDGQPWWWSDAACNEGTGALLATFFSDRPDDIAFAKSICAGCVPRQLCLAGALRRGESSGVWGGELLCGGRVLAEKRPRGRPRKAVPAITATPATGAMPGIPQTGELPAARSA